MLHSGHFGKKIEKMIEILCLVNMFSALCLKRHFEVKFIVHVYKIRSSVRHTPMGGLSLHDFIVLNSNGDLYIPSHLSSGTGSCMYF